MDMTRVPWLHQKLHTLVVPLLLNDASVTSVDLDKGKSVSGGRARLYCLKYPQSPLPKHAQRIHADMRPAHPPVLCPRQTLKPSLLSAACCDDVCTSAACAHTHWSTHAGAWRMVADGRARAHACGCRQPNQGRRGAGPGGGAQGQHGRHVHQSSRYVCASPGGGRGESGGGVQGRRAAAAGRRRPGRVCAHVCAL